MGKVQVLDALVTNRIAAGQVVENPASVAKELVENSLDAGATRIDITIASGGVELIRVSDNGHGMSKEDIKLAVERYATSKISNVSDLDQINSFGFRGEALPSIAAVSRFTLRSRQEKTTHGYELTLTGGKLEGETDIPMSEGTVIEVKDLFFNIPARRKFLRSDKYEKAVIADTLTALALSNYHCSFQFKEGKKEIFNYPKMSSWEERIKQVFSKESKEMLTLDETKGEFRLYGLVSKPGLQRGNRSKQYFFINNRHVKFPPLSYSIQEAYDGYLLHGRFPYLILFVEAPLDRVDVNIHPQKEEVKVENSRMLQELAFKSIRAKVAGREHLDFDNIPKENVIPIPKHSHSHGNNENQKIEFETHVIQQDTIATEPPKQAEEPLNEQLYLANEKPFGIHKILGQLHLTYLVCETEKGLLMIDQHAAHERVMFE